MADFQHISIDGTSYDAIPSGSYVTGVKGSAESTYRHGNVNLSKTNVGLGNVPNVTTNNQTPTFSQASTRDNLVSGDKLSALFSKIMKWFADLKTVAFTGNYSDLNGQPTIPTVNDATLTIQKNGSNVGTFTANASSNRTINITMAKSDVGLGNVPNVATNNQTPTFTQASTLSNIASGEKLSVIFGKLKKLFSSLTSETLSPNGTLYVVSDIQGLGLVTYLNGPPLASSVTANFTSLRLLKNGTWYTLTMNNILLKSYGTTQITFNVPTGWSYDLGKSYTLEATGTITYT